MSLYLMKFYIIIITLFVMRISFYYSQCHGDRLLPSQIFIQVIICNRLQRTSGVVFVPHWNVTAKHGYIVPKAVGYSTVLITTMVDWEQNRRMEIRVESIHKAVPQSRNWQEWIQCGDRIIMFLSNKPIVYQSCIFSYNMWTDRQTDAVKTLVPQWLTNHLKMFIWVYLLKL